MVIGEEKKRLAPQKCPLCGSLQDVAVNGHIPHPVMTDKLLVDPDRGYSFCNCRNIFFTDWSNIKQSLYNDAYAERYDSEHTNRLLRNYLAIYGKMFTDNGLKDGDNVLEIGCANRSILDKFRELGYKTTGIDIIKHNWPEHNILTGNFEEMEISDKFGLIFASHLFEHFKNPIAAVNKCYELLKPGGIIFISMPDPYFIDFKSPYAWGHWHIEEHYIMWDLQSFCDVLSENGINPVYATHNVQNRFVCLGDFHIIGRKNE